MRNGASEKPLCRRVTHAAEVKWVVGEHGLCGAALHLRSLTGVTELYSVPPWPPTGPKPLISCQLTARPAAEGGPKEPSTGLF